MPKSVLPRPTEAELAILQVLWDQGPSTVREVCEALNKRRRSGAEALRAPVGYTTVLKLMQIMAKKGLVRRDESRKSHVYEATSPEAKTQRQLVGDLLERAFGGSAERLVMRALEEKRASAEELARIRQLLDNMKGGAS